MLQEKRRRLKKASSKATKTVVVTGSLEGFSRSGIKEKLESMGRMSLEA